MGIEPPSRVKTGRRPKACSIARAAASMYGLSSGTSTPGEPWCSISSISTPGGHSSASFRFRPAVILAGSWLGTRRKLNFAPAEAGKTVLAPSP